MGKQLEPRLKVSNERERCSKCRARTEFSLKTHFASSFPWRDKGHILKLKLSPTEKELRPAVFPDSVFPSSKPILSSSRTLNNALSPALTPRGCVAGHINTFHSLPFRIRNNTHHQRERSAVDSQASLGGRKSQCIVVGQKGDGGTHDIARHNYYPLCGWWNQALKHTAWLFQKQMVGNCRIIALWP